MTTNVDTDKIFRQRKKKLDSDNKLENENKLRK